MNKTLSADQMTFEQVVGEAPVDIERLAMLQGVQKIIIRSDLPNMVTGTLSPPKGDLLLPEWTVEVNGRHHADRRRYLIAWATDHHFYADDRIGTSVAYDIEYLTDEHVFSEDPDFFIEQMLVPYGVGESLGYGTTVAPHDVAEALAIPERALHIAMEGHGISGPEDFMALSPEAVMAEIEPGGQAKIERLMTEAPVDIEGIAVEHGLTIRIRGDLPDEALGSLLHETTDCGMGERWTIEVNGRHHIHRRRHTMALELAHFLNHRDAVGDGVTHQRSGSGGLDPEREAAANAFAADLLMPRPLIDRLRARPKPPLIGIARTLSVSDRALAVRTEGRRDPRPEEFENPQAA